MIFGGDGPNGKLKSVELYNWKSGQQCSYGEIPYGSAAFAAAVLDGVPVFCGGAGAIDDVYCQRYDKDGRKWERVSYFFQIIKQ